MTAQYFAESLELAAGVLTGDHPTEIAGCVAVKIPGDQRKDTGSKQRSRDLFRGASRTRYDTNDGSWGRWQIQAGLNEALFHEIGIIPEPNQECGVARQEAKGFNGAVNQWERDGSSACELTAVFDHTGAK